MLKNNTGNFPELIFKRLLSLNNNSLFLMSFDPDLPHWYLNRMGHFETLLMTLDFETMGQFAHTTVANTAMTGHLQAT